MSADLVWRKSSYSGGDPDNCIEVAKSDLAVHVRDSKDVDQGSFAVSASAWSSFLTSTKP
ncbi:DUF397 domain-containing protein [Streptomyces sp. NPDC002120]|uniref:DUF397 domain-containing protein n=1 Tax=Streptomyces sp. NPDC002120 TaxID=3364631 RepID=UPI0036AD41E2